MSANWSPAGAGGDDSALGVDGEGVAEVAGAVEVGGQGGVEGAVGFEADERHVADGGAGGAADEDDVAVGVHDEVVAEVVLAAEVGLGDAEVAEPEVQLAVGAVAGDDRVVPFGPPPGAGDQDRAAGGDGDAVGDSSVPRSLTTVPAALKVGSSCPSGR